VKWEYIGAGLALIGIGLTMVLALPPPGWPTMPIWAVRFGIATGGVLIIVGAALIALGVLPWLIAYTLPVSFATLSAAAALIAVMALYWSPSADVTTAQDIREISREELARRSLEIVAEMRELQNETDIKQRRRWFPMPGEPPPPPRSPENPGVVDLQAEMIAKFAKDLRPKARLLAVEILRRQGIYAPYPSELLWQGSPILMGTVAGPSPVGDAANWLEDITRRLPP